ncbi:Hpt domain-containing protein [Treponema sp.]|uniref:Hpt domain-containing protein n=1 Tax=Treponema sp. TaxID=166 RepID=UPI003F0429BC
MDLINEMKTIGADMDAGLSRFMGNTQLLETMLKKLPESIAQNSGIDQDIESGNISAAILKSHTLKGNTGNLSVTPLFKMYTELTDLLRAQKIPEAKELLKKILPVQKTVLDIIARHS